MKNTFIIFTLFFILSGNRAILTAQPRAIRLQWQLVSHTQDSASLKQSSSFSNIAAARQKVHALLDSLQQTGHLLASSSDIQCKDTLCQVKITTGPLFQWLQLDVSNIDQRLLARAGFRQNEFHNTPLHYRKIHAFQRNLLRQAAENGYPLAQVWLDSLKFDIHGNSSARILLRKGPQITYGEMQIHGDADISAKNLQRLLHLPKGKTYRQSQVDDLQQKLQNLPYLQLAAPIQWLFSNEQAIPILQLKKKNASSFDFLFGLNSRNSSGSPQVSFTGQLRADFFNAFKSGERLQMQYEQLTSGTRKLSLQANYPFISYLPIGGNGRFEQFKQDTSFNDLLWRIGISYPLQTSQYISMYWQGNSSSLITIDTAEIKQSKQLPPKLDLQQKGVGFELYLKKLDTPFNPRKGWKITIDASLFQKKILPNPLITELKDDQQTEFDFASLYDSLKTNSSQSRVQTDLQLYIPLFQFSALQIRVQAGTFPTKTTIFQNELFQLGGYRTLRGFEERFFRASSYVISSLEYRWITGPDSRFYLFIDYGWIEEQSIAGKFTNHPLGIGAGLTFNTPAGQLAVNLALGKQDSQNLDWRRPKINLGYIGRF